MFQDTVLNTGRRDFETLEHVVTTTDATYLMIDTTGHENDVRDRMSRMYQVAGHIKQLLDDPRLALRFYLGTLPETPNM